MAVNIHSQAIVSSGAHIGKNVTIGPFSVIEGGAVIGDGCEIGSHAYIGLNTSIGSGCRIFHGASVGTIPQDLKYNNENTVLVIGSNTIIREFCTINRGTVASGKTVIGSNCALLAYCHVAHDCILGDNVVISNNLSMAGHVEVGNHVIIGGDVAIHQFTRIGNHSFIGARSYLVKDVVPFSLCARGETGVERIVGINKIGLERRGFSEERRRMIKRSYKVLFRDQIVVQDAIQKLHDENNDNVDIMELVAFVKKSRRGIYSMLQ